MTEQAARVSRQIAAVTTIQKKENKATHEPAGPGPWGWAGVEVATSFPDLGDFKKVGQIEWRWQRSLWVYMGLAK